MKGALLGPIDAEVVGAAPLLQWAAVLCHSDSEASCCTGRASWQGERAAGTSGNHHTKSKIDHLQLNFQLREVFSRPPIPPVASERAP
eukprot:scaffold2330_cov177-Skeletonema_marinoi.AAC.4